jgi:hypothetical protein
MFCSKQELSAYVLILDEADQHILDCVFEKGSPCYFAFKPAIH